MEKTIICLAAAFCFCAAANAQKNKADEPRELKPKDIEKAEETLQTLAENQKDSVEKWRELEAKAKQALAAAKERNARFDPNSPEAIKKRLGSMTLQDVINDQKLRKSLEANKSPLAQAYLTICRMDESLNKIYDKKSNEEFKASIDSIRSLVLEQHKAVFEELASKINDYEFVMSELARVFRLVDKKGDNATVDQLSKDNELVYIVKIPYAKNTLTDYIGKSNPKRRELCQEINEIYPDFGYNGPAPK